MMDLVESRILDSNAESLGVSVASLMDNAGAAVADFLSERYPDQRILFVCGPGNNGGDGFAAALRMDPSRTCVAMLKKGSSIHSDIARERYSLLECDIAPYSSKLFDGYDVVVDCALGTGISSDEVREPYRTFIIDVNSSGKPVVSVDIPSGLGMDIAVIPRTTLTFHDVKRGMDESNSGEIRVCDIGIPRDAHTYVGPGDMLRYPVPDHHSHKGQNGRLMIIGGGPYFGAPAMSGMAALRTGTDIVRVFTPSNCHDIVASYSPVLMVTAIEGASLGPGSVEQLLVESRNYDCVLIGPGLGSAPGTLSAAREFITGCKTPMVIDADAIRVTRGMRFTTPVVLTPHQGEFHELDEGGSDPGTLASSMNATILLKGHEDTITDGHDLRLNRTGTPAMTGAGTGDVLAGTVAGLMSKGMSAFNAASLGAYICGRAGEIAFDELSYGLVATDIVDRIPIVLREGLD